MAEFDLIERIRARVATRADVVLGIGDDAALLQVPAGMQLVVAMDTLNAGVHFPEGTAPADIGWKALAVNLSDLAAMGAAPAWCTLSLSLPQPDARWVDAFLDGFLALADAHRVALIGGDTTRGPLSICVTAHGVVEPGRAVRRDGARIGDDVWVSGTLGDAAAGLARWRGDAPDVEAADAASRAAHDTALRMRLDRPTPRVALGGALAGLAHACIDVSDGLLADLAHIARASGAAIEIDVDALPASDPLHATFARERCRVLQATGGDDYELCFTAPPRHAAEIERAAADCAVRLTRIGRVHAGSGVRVRCNDGAPWAAPRAGYVHFA
ncbi:thiamine-phosphate kinase [Cognatilysobacter bugurensis]|uniref:Thiamine-monophosphate kinase n=1 Tax=Cognatilysobacter bugurensis TaxID=543356 RepID=A0A918T2C8_9GAMM|nr:thiamine-phosphate kinase [Lysobacter bugurensis]GHA85230.1 thiamine-monophosphate kinase [Lysobacter bugurensis]